MPVLFFLGVLFLVYAVILLIAGQPCPAVSLCLLAYVVFRIERARTSLDPRDDDAVG
jgi:hypothetical protein